MSGGVRRRGRMESRPRHGRLLPVPVNVEKARFLKRLGAIADVPFAYQLEIDYAKMAAFVPQPQADLWNKVPDPTPEEIKATCAEIRETWDKNRWKKEDMRKEAEFPVINTSEIGL